MGSEPQGVEAVADSVMDRTQTCFVLGPEANSHLKNVAVLFVIFTNEMYTD